VPPAIVLACSLLAACASPRKAAPVIADATGGGELIAPEALAAWMGPGGPRELTMTITAGDDAGKTWMVRPEDVQRAQDGTLKGFTITWTLGQEPRPRSEREMLIDADGSLTMARVVDRPHSVITVFDPPVLVIPARINSGATVRQDCRVTVYELKDPKRVKTRGDAAVEARYNGVEAGSPDKLRVLTTTLDLNLTAARSRRTTTRWFHPDHGLLRERFEEQVRVLGVIIESSGQTMEVAPLPPGAEPHP